MTSLSREAFVALPPIDQIAAVPATVPFVAPEELARGTGHEGLLRLGANESSFGPPPAVIEAMRRGRLRRRVEVRRPRIARDLREALARRHRCEVDEISVASGIDELLGLLVRAYLGAGEIAVTTSGSYPTFAYHVLGYGSRIETVPYTEEGRVRLDGLVEAARRTNARLVYLANPDNPSGSFAHRDDVTALVEALPSRTLLVLDEAYADFVPDDDLFDAPIDPRIVRLRTFSKAYGLAGARIGYLLGMYEVVATFQKIRLHYGVNRLAQVAAITALGEAAYVREIVAEIERGRAEYAQLAEHLGTTTLPSRTNFVLFDVGTAAKRRADRSGAAASAASSSESLGLRPWSRYVRVSVGRPSERERLSAALAEALVEVDANS